MADAGMKKEKMRISSVTSGSLVHWIQEFLKRYLFYPKPFLTFEVLIQATI